MDVFVEGRIFDYVCFRWGGSRYGLALYGFQGDLIGCIYVVVITSKRKGHVQFMTVVVGLGHIIVSVYCVHDTFHGLCNHECGHHEDTEEHGNPGSWPIRARYGSRTFPQQSLRDCLIA